MGLSRQENWGGLPFSSPGDLPDPGIEPNSPASPALAGGFCYHGATWEALRVRKDLNNTIGWLRSIVLLYQSARWFFLLPLKLGKHFASSSITGWSQTLHKTGPRHTCSNQSKQGSNFMSQPAEEENCLFRTAIQENCHFTWSIPGTQ